MRRLWLVLIPVLMAALVVWAQDKPAEKAKAISTDAARWQALATSLEEENKGLRRNLAICTADSTARQAELDKLTKPDVAPAKAPAPKP